MTFLKYATAATLRGIPLLSRGLADYKSAPTLAAGDVKVRLDGAAEANIATLPTATGTYVDVILSVAELTAKIITVTFIDQTSPKEWEDQRLIIHTYGHADSLHPGP